MDDAPDSAYAPRSPESSPEAPSEPPPVGDPLPAGEPTLVGEHLPAAEPLLTSEYPAVEPYPAYDEQSPPAEPTTGAPPVAEPGELAGETPRRRRSPALLITIIAAAVLLLGAGGAIAYLITQRWKMEDSFADMAQAALTIAGTDQSGEGQVIRRYISNGQYAEAAAAMKASAAAAQPAGAEMGPLGALLGQFGGRGGRGGRGGGTPGTGAPAQPGQAGQPGQPGQPGATGGRPGGMSGRGGRQGAAGGGGGGIDPEVAKMIPPEFMGMAQQMLANVPPAQQREMVQRLLGGNRPAGAPGGAPSGAQPSGRPSGRQGRGGTGLASRGSGMGGTPGSRPSGPPAGAPGGRPGGFGGPPPGGEAPGTGLGPLLSAIPPGVNPDMIRTLMGSATKPEDKGAVSALAAFVLARQLGPADFDKYGLQLAQIMLAGVNSTTPASLADMARRFGPFMGGMMGGEGGPGRGMAGRRGQADEPGVREAMRQLAPQYYAAKNAGKNLTEIDKVLDDARTKLYARDYGAAMRSVREAQRMLTEMK